MLCNIRALLDFWSKREQLNQIEGTLIMGHKMEK